MILNIDYLLIQRTEAQHISAKYLFHREYFSVERGEKGKVIAADSRSCLLTRRHSDRCLSKSFRALLLLEYFH